VLTAIEIWFESRDAAAERQRWYDDLEALRRRVARLPGTDGEVLEPTGMDRVPRLRVFWDRRRYPLDGLELRRQLLDGTPRIMLDDNSATEDAIAIDPFALQPGEAAQVGDAIATVLGAARRTQAAASQSPALTLAGDWELQVDFLRGARHHRLAIEQRGADLVGHQSSVQFEGPVQGRLEADRVEFVFDGHFEGSRIMYRFSGTVRDGAMGGTVELGAASATAPGPVNLSQFGTGEWRAQRLA
jgi:hypothetical protein